MALFKILTMTGFLSILSNPNQRVAANVLLSTLRYVVYELTAAQEMPCWLAGSYLIQPVTYVCHHAAITFGSSIKF